MTNPTLTSKRIASAQTLQGHDYSELPAQKEMANQAERAQAASSPNTALPREKLEKGKRT
jgi:hypothetical protein